MKTLILSILFCGVCAAADYPTDSQFKSACQIYGVKTYLEVARIYLQNPSIVESDLEKTYRSDWRLKIVLKAISTSKKK